MQFNQYEKYEKYEQDSEQYSEQEEQLQHLKHNKQLNVNKIISKTKNLTDNEKRHILNILLTYKVEYSKNQSGYFFYLEKISNEIIDKILKCIDLIEEKSDLIYNLDKRRDEHLEYYKSLIENKLKETINLKKKALIDNLRLIEEPFYIIKKKTNKKVQFTDEDPDKLMKEHLKKYKYKKDSIYHRISQVMIQMSRKNKHRHVKEDRSGGGGGEEDSKGSDGGGDIGGGDDIGGDEIGGEIGGSEIGDDIGEIDDEIGDKIGDDISEDFNESELEDNEYYNSDSDSDSDDDSFDNTSDIDNTETEHTDTETQTHTQTKTRKIKKKTKISSNELDYYKNLLKKGGFKFDDDKEVIMIKEKYIE
jgi:hypothetical protein